MRGLERQEHNARGMCDKTSGHVAAIKTFEVSQIIRLPHPRLA